MTCGLFFFFFFFFNLILLSFETNFSVVDLTVRLKKGASKADIDAAIKKAAEGPMQGIMRFSDEDIVSCDLIGSTHSSVYDSKASIALTDTFVKLISFYDNECGYSNR